MAPDEVPPTGEVTGAGAEVVVVGSGVAVVGIGAGVVVVTGAVGVGERMLVTANGDSRSRRSGSYQQCGVGCSRVIATWASFEALTTCVLRSI